MIRRDYIFYGRVQGVGFRFYAVEKARSLGLTGWVMNCDDGSVRMQVQGSTLAIERLVHYLKGRTYIAITHYDCQEIPCIKESSFQERGW